VHGIKCKVFNGPIYLFIEQLVQEAALQVAQVEPPPPFIWTAVNMREIFVPLHFGHWTLSLLEMVVKTSNLWSQSLQTNS